MGFNIIQGNCPQCAKNFRIETQLTGSDFVIHRRGDHVGLDGAIELSQSCSYCNAVPVALFKFGVLIGFSTDGATHRELDGKLMTRET